MSNSAFDDLPDEELAALQKVLPAMAPEHLREKSAPEILALWEQTVQKVLAEYEGGMDEYVGELKTRELIDDALRLPSSSPLTKTQAMIELRDQTFRTATRTLRTPLVENSNPERYWFYYRIPKNRGSQMRREFDDLDRAVEITGP